MNTLKVKRFEEATILSLLGTWFIWFTGEPIPSGNECIIIFCMMFLMACFVMWFSGFRASKKQDKYITKKVPQNIHNLTVSMYSKGYRLQETGGNIYVFATSNIFLPNRHFIAKDFDNYCALSGYGRDIKILKNDLKSVGMLFKKEDTKDANQ